MKRAISKDSAKSPRSYVTSTRNRFFNVDDFVGSRATVARALSRLADDGELVRVKRGLYWRGTKTPLGMSPPSSTSVLRAVYGKSAGVGPTRLDAARKLGLTTQVARTPAFAVPFVVEGLSSILINRARRTGRARHNLDDAEIALFEVLHDWDNVVELSSADAVQRLRSLIGNLIRPEAVAAASTTESARVRERLRALLILAGFKKDALRVLPAANAKTRAEAFRSIPELVAT